MRLIKPYGRSHVAAAETKNKAEAKGETKANLTVRKLWQSKAGHSEDVVEFAKTNPELLIAQWISTIDKIATKPRDKNKLTEKQRNFRKKLGEAAWKILKEKIFPCDPDHSELKKRWDARIAPYGSDTKPNSKGKGDEAKGRWYKRFAGDADVLDADTDDIARHIYKHLHETGYRLSKSSKCKKLGHIEAQAKSISNNVLQYKPATAKDVEEVYKSKPDIAEAIKEAVEKGGKQSLLSLAGKELYEHYGKLFKKDGNSTLTVGEAKEFHPALFALHEAVKACYARLLKHPHKKRQKENKALLETLPQNMDALMCRVRSMKRNTDLAARVRLGKILHYESGGVPEQLMNLTELNKSRYWSSDGQAEIKRNEAFVRIWRRVLALAQRTLTDWADPKGEELERDVLITSERTKALENFDHVRCKKKLELLFGAQAKLFSDTEEHSKWALGFALCNISKLRNSAFHFKGFSKFLNELNLTDNSTNTDDNSEIQQLKCLWQQDFKDRKQRRIDTLKAAHVDYFLNQSQADKLLVTLEKASPIGLPLPRFSRMLEKAGDTCKEENRLQHLPLRGTRETLKRSAALCRYTVLKMLYEGAFRNWIEKDCDRVKLNEFIKQAQDRGRDSAKEINKNKSIPGYKLILARSERLGNISETGDGGIWSYFHDLTRETATEMRVQSGYESDSKEARKQAGYIEDFKREFVARAFDHWLGKDFGFLQEIKEELPDKPKLLSKLELTEESADNTAKVPVADWQYSLYFLMHLVPVGAAGGLLHQIRKWKLLALPSNKITKDTPSSDKDTKKAEETAQDIAQGCEEVLNLYLDMHDAKFEGGEALLGVEEFKEFFEDHTDFDSVFPPSNTEEKPPNDEEEQRTPVRGLREISRFGHLPILKRLCGEQKIYSKDVKAVQDAEKKNGKELSQIAKNQKKRKKLHKELVRHKNKCTPENIKEYEKSLTFIVEHRHRAAQVRLTDHMRIHQLMMDVLGRLVDFAGLWERDLYFTTLALIHEKNKTPEEVFGKKTFIHLKKGCISIIQAWKELHKQNEEEPSDTQKHVLKQLEYHFGKIKKLKKIRNDIMHFNYLQNGQKPLNLTECVNDTRQLMAYDRKLKNAVSKAVRELVARGGLDLRWGIRTDDKHNHKLTEATLETKRAKHLGKSHLKEDLHGEQFVKMAAALFDGEPKEQRAQKNAPGNHGKKKQHRK